MRRSARSRELELRRVEVDGDDRARARDAERGDDLQPDATAADDDRRLAGLDPGGVPDRAERRDDAASEKRRLPERKLAWQGHRAGRRDDRALGEARGHEGVLERRPVRAATASTCRP